MVGVAPPSQDVIDAVESGVANITRRVELYESDGLTPWGDEVPRMTGGSISIDYGRDERRTLDFELSNASGWLRPDPLNFWYDKVIKVYRGIEYNLPKLPPRVVIIEALDQARADAMLSLLTSLGYTRTTIALDTATYSSIAAYDIVVSDMAFDSTGKGTILQTAYLAGKSVITIGSQNTSAVVPMVTGTVALSGDDYDLDLISPNRLQSSVFPYVTEQGIAPTLGTPQFIASTLSASNAESVAIQSNNGVGVPGSLGVVGWNSSGGKWFQWFPQVWTTNTKIILASALDWMWGYSSSASWEIQLGEFLIDRMDDANFPHTVKVTGRDYTKRALLSKVATSLTFASGTNLATLVSAVAANAGITKQRIAAAPEVLGSALSIERGTDRWSIIRDAANSFNYELYVDNQGYLVMEKFRDPTTDAINAHFRTGPTGNLAKLNRSTNDSRLFNNIIVTGDRNDGGLPYFGQAKNTQIDSPTSIAKLGDRVYMFNSSFFASDAQCASYAQTLLKVNALETFEMSCEAIVYPWMEAGTIVEILDPNALSSDPTRYLCDSITIPLNLGAMSFTGKRVTIVG